MRMRSLASVILLGALACVIAAHAQDQGPMAPPPTINVRRLPSVPHPGPPPIPEQQIIPRFAANEDAFYVAGRNGHGGHSVLLSYNCGYSQLQFSLRRPAANRSNQYVRLSG